MEEYIWISKLVNHPVFVSHAHPILKRLETEYDVKIKIAGPDDTSDKLFIKSFNEAVTHKVAGIMLVGWDSKEIIPAVNNAIESGIPVVTIDSDLPGSNRLAHVGTDWLRMGSAMADKVVELIDNRGKVLIIGMTGPANMEAGFHGFKQRIGSIPDIEIFGPENDMDILYDRAEAIVTRYIKEHPDLAGIVGFDGNSGPGAALALEKTGKVKDIKLVCVDADEPHLKRIRSGAIDAAFCQKREAFTYLAFEMLYSYNHGSAATGYQPGLLNIPGNIDTGTILVTLDNIDSFNTELNIDDTFTFHEQAKQLTLLSGMIKNVAEITLATDLTGKIVYSNPAVYRLTGYTENDLSNLSINHIFQMTPDQASRLSECKTEQQSFSFETTARRKDGHKFPVQLSVSPFSTDSIVRGIVLVAIDITEHKKVVAALHESEQRHRITLDSMKDWIHVVNRDLTIILANDAIIKMNKQFGFETNMLNRSVFDIYPFLTDKIRDEYNQVFETGKTYVTEEFNSIDKKDFHTETRKIPVFEGGQVRYVITVIRDIIERKNVEQALRESAERYRLLFERNLAGVYHTSLDGQIYNCNDSFAKILGYDSAEEVRKLNASEFYFSEADRDVFIKKLTKNKSITNLEGRLRRKDNTPVWIIENVNLVSDETGAPAFIEGTLFDITDRKIAEAALLESEEKFRSVVQNAHEGIVIIDDHSKILYANDKISELTGYTQEELLSQNFIDFIADESKNFVLERYKQRLEGDTSSIHYVMNTEHKDGQIRTVEVSASTIVDSSGKMKIIAELLDITERAKSEQLQKTVYRIMQIAQGSRSMNELYEALHTVIQDVMPAENFYIALYNDAEDELSFPYFIDEVDRPSPSHKPGRGATEYVLRTGKPLLCTAEGFEDLERRGEVELVGAPSAIWLGVPLISEDKTIGVMVVQHYTDPEAYGEQEKYILEFVSSEVAKAIERKRTEEALRESEEKYREIIENSLEGIFVSQNNLIQFCNHRFAEMFLIKDTRHIIGKPLRELVSPKDRDMVERQNQSLENNEYKKTHYNFKARRDDGTEFEVETLSTRILFNGKPAAQSVIRDVSEQRQLEEQLRQAQKMEAVGRLAGGIAHDFNNLLTVISGHAELALLSLNQNDPFYKTVTEIYNASDRASTLTKQLLAFSRKQALEMKVLDLNAVLSNMDDMLRRIIGENIDITTIPSRKLWKVKADPGQLEQVLVNLVVNSRDAMPKGGKLTIETSNIELDETYTITHPGASEGDYVMLTVSDTGCGMTEDVKVKVFDPFFTTKEEGIGTGLGLSMVYGIVKQSGGSIWVYSEPDHGTTFKIYLPKVEDETVEFKFKTDKLDAPTGSETILVVEDEDAVRKLTVLTLKRLGYNVIDARNGGEAFLICEKMEEPIDLIVTDVIMPKMTGSELIARLRKIWANIKVLYMSGYTPNAIIQEGILKPGTPYIQKPFRLLTMAQKVREALER